MKILRDENKNKNVEYLQFKNENHFVFIFKGIMQIDQFVVMQMIHDVDLFPRKKINSNK
jgi:hypothetical protein